jgi:hypothetical protein
MSLKSKVSISVCLLLAVSICIYSQVPVVHSWYSETHESIASTAINLMPPYNWDWFFQTYSSTIVNYSNKPDQWKSSDPNEQYRHWYHVDVNYPDGHDESDYGDGVLPWAVEDNFNTFVQYLRENDWDHAAQLAGVISHYVGDASMPLHATSNYSPGGSQNHTTFESAVDSHLDEINMIMSGFAPHELDNVFDSTMQLLNDSYSYASVLSPYLENGTFWNDNIKNMTENRLRTSAQLLANIWYTAAVQAGIPNQLPTPDATPTDYTPYVVGGVLAIVVISIVLVLHMRRR